MTGPTGSGKSTTLYSALNAINKPDRKIITVEDPVEYEVAGTNQVQVYLMLDDFSAALRNAPSGSKYCNGRRDPGLGDCRECH